MSHIKFKSLARRGGAFSLAVAFMSVVALTAVPNLTYADALNPLTERSLLLSSSAPGYIDKDAAGNPGTYAPPGSGPNGKQSGETFSFKVSTDSVAANRAIKAFTLQYCTKAAGLCVAPGDNTGDYDPNDDGTYTDSTRLLNETPTTGGWALNKSDLNVVGTFANDDDAAPEAGEFVVLVEGVESTGWTMTAINAESENASTNDQNLTGKNNLIRLTHSGAGAAPTAGQKVDIVFRPSNSVYITNPGSEAFFVKINTYDSELVTDLIPASMPPNNENIIDGGVTVANVMTKSIEIRTKVLETMAFSVGTENPDVEVRSHGPCDAISANNPINMGSELAEFSLEVDKAFDGQSYWRLSSNSSNGAIVYYSGYSLANTNGDQIDGINDGVLTAGTKAKSNPGEEQFGLAYNNAPDSFDTTPLNNPVTVNNLDTLTIEPDYANGNGTITSAGTAEFAWDPDSLTVPTVLARGATDVVACATGKMRYVANIAASTPAGIYTSAVNYLASPQY